jgi:hypothetical protein
MQGLDQFERGRFREDDHAVGARQRCHQPRAFHFRHERAARPLAEGSCGRIRVDADDERLSERARRFQKRDVPDMEEVEDPIGEDDRPGLRCTPRGGRPGGANLVRGVQSDSVAFGWNWNL